MINFYRFDTHRCPVCIGGALSSRAVVEVEWVSLRDYRYILHPNWSKDSTDVKASGLSVLLHVYSWHLQAGQSLCNVARERDNGKLID